MLYDSKVILTGSQNFPNYLAVAFVAIKITTNLGPFSDAPH